MLGRLVFSDLHFEHGVSVNGEKLVKTGVWSTDCS